MSERDSSVFDEEERPMGMDQVDEWEEVAVEDSTRSAVLTVRFSPQELRQLRNLASATDQTMAEVVRNAVKASLPRRGQLVSMGWSWSAGAGNANVLARSGLVTIGQGTNEEVEPATKP